MPDIQPIRTSIHMASAWTPSSGYRFAADTLIVPIAAEELAHAARSFPLAFSSDKATQLVAVLGLQQGNNLFIAANDKWLGGYIPALLRSYPFKLLPAADDQFALGYDHASGLITEPGQGEAFFTHDGKPTDRIQSILGFLVGVSNGLKRTAAAAAVLQRHDMLEPWDLKIKDGDREIPVTGLQRISEQKLTQADDATFLALRIGGALPMAYAQLLSMGNIETLGKLARLHAQHAQQAAKHQEDIKSMFIPPQVEDEIDWEAMFKSDDKI